jgi:hypothetical protein
LYKGIIPEIGLGGNSMRRNNDVNLLAVILGSVVGTLIGLVVGLMIAPKSGNDLRNELVSTGRDFMKKAKSRKDDLFDALDDEIEEIGDFASDILDEN